MTQGAILNGFRDSAASMPVRVEDIAIAVRPVPPAVTISAILGTFHADKNLFAIPVVREGAALGMVTRLAATEAMSRHDAREIIAGLPVTEFMSTAPVMAEEGSPAALVAKLASEGNTTALTDGVIVLSGGRYLGLISPAVLLAAVAEENGARARAMKANQQRLAKAKREIDLAAAEKSRFLAFVGHEIRTPLTGILGVADLLQDSAHGEAKRLAQTISESGTHLDRLLSDLLDLSRLEAGKLSIANAPFDLREFANDARDLWQSRIAGKRLDLRIKVDGDAVPRLESDAMRIRQILFNLMSNALKFTERGYISVELSTLEASGNLKLRMTVEDTGCGISDEDKARLFEAFEQAKATTAQTHGGTGLGLSIARGLAQRLGGEIMLADNPEGGSIFTVTLPVQRAGPRLAVSGMPLKPRTRAFELGRILLAEDHAVSALVITRALSAAGWQIDTARTGEDALDLARHGAYQAILMDIHMPGTNGDEVLKAIREEGGPNAATPVIAVTADVSPERRLACNEAGFSSLIEKPIRPRALVAALADVLIAGSVTEADERKLA